MHESLDRLRWTLLWLLLLLPAGADKIVIPVERTQEHAELNLQNIKTSKQLFLSFSIFSSSGRQQLILLHQCHLPGFELLPLLLMLPPPLLLLLRLPSQCLPNQ